MEGEKMSEPNEPPLEIVEYNIKVKWSDGNEEIIPKDFYNYCKDLQNIVDGFEEETIDHLKGKYGQEIEQAEDLHAQNSGRFVDYEKKSD
jgi:hypothetical protein